MANALYAMSKTNADPRNAALFNMANHLQTSVVHVLEMAKKNPGLLAKALAAKGAPPPEKPAAAVGAALAEPEPARGFDQGGPSIPSGAPRTGYDQGGPPAAANYGVPAPQPGAPANFGAARVVPVATAPPVIPAPVPVPSANAAPTSGPGPGAREYPASAQAAAIAAAQDAVRTATQDSVKDPSSNPLLVGAMLNGVKAPAQPGYVSPVSPPSPHAIPIDKGEGLLAMLGLGAHRGQKALGG